jgi:DNA repair exonuclease SbcCD nuclease subunit
MSPSPFRFVHAANVRLDQPMWGIGEMTGESRRLAEEATNLAFEQVVETAISEGADFLLLTGNTFDASAGYRPRLLLEQACERLADHDCQVLILPGDHDRPHLWNDLHLPSSVTVLSATHGEPIELIRRGSLLAVVEPFIDRQQSAVPGQSQAVRIGLADGIQHADLQEVLAINSGRPLEVSQSG